MSKNENPNSSQITLISYLSGSNENGLNNLPEQTDNNYIIPVSGPNNTLTITVPQEKDENLLPSYSVNIKDEQNCFCSCNNDLQKSPLSISETLAKYDKKLKHSQNVRCCHYGKKDSIRYPEQSKTIECLDDKQSILKEIAKNTFKRKTLNRRLPIFEWFPQYNFQKGIFDLVAGITVGLTVVPQAIAYANVAGVSPEYGLYSSFMACFVYTIFGSCKDSAVGLSAITAILTNEYTKGLSIEYVILLCFLNGCVALLMGILQLGFLIDFISGPVSVGFTSAAAIIIASSQIKDILGFKLNSSKFLNIWEEVIENFFQKTNWHDALLGVSCILVLLFLRKMKDFCVCSKDEFQKNSCRNFFEKFLWLLSTARNIVVVVFCAVMCSIFDPNGQVFHLTGYVKPGLPQVNSPPFSITTANNETVGFFDMVQKLGSGVIIVPILAIVEDISLAKVFSEGKAIDATQEMISIGLCNMASSFVGSLPVTGALARGAVNHASGAQTTLGGIYTGIIVLISLKFFTPYFYFIPKASLAAVIIAAVIFMVEFHVVKPIWKTKKIDLIPAMVTFLSCLFIRLELGIVIGIITNVMFLLYASARPSLHLEKVTSGFGFQYLLVTPDSSLRFPSVEYVRKSISKAGVKQGLSLTPVVIDARHIQGVDFTAAEGIKTLIDDFGKREQLLVFYHLKPSIETILQRLNPNNLRICHTETELNELLRIHTKS